MSNQAFQSGAYLGTAPAVGRGGGEGGEGGREGGRGKSGTRTTFGQESPIRYRRYTRLTTKAKAGRQQS